MRRPADRDWSDAGRPCTDRSGPGPLESSRPQFRRWRSPRRSPHTRNSGYLRNTAPSRNAPRAPRLQCLLLRPHVVVDFKRRVPWLFISSSGATAPQKNEDQNDKRGNDREIHQPQQQREAHAPLQRENQPVRCARRRNVAPYGGFHPHDRLQPPANRSARALCKRHRFRLFHARNLLRRRVDRVSFRRASGARCARNATAPDGRRRSVHHSPKRSALTIVGPTNTSLRCVFRRP